MNQLDKYLLLKTRLGKVISENFPSVNSFATKAGIPHATVFKWKDLEDSTKPGIDIAIKIAELLPNINLRWLLTGETDDNISYLVNESNANYSKSMNSKDSMIELQQKHIVMLEREIERLSELVIQNLGHSAVQIVQEGLSTDLEFKI